MDDNKQFIIKKLVRNIPLMQMWHKECELLKSQNHEFWFIYSE